jgi:hypothetical protein
VNDGPLIEIIHGGDDAILEFLFGYDTDVTQDGTDEFGEEALDEIEPGAVLGSEGEFETVRGLLGEPRPGLLGDVCGMIVEDQLDRSVGWIGGVEKLEEFDEFAAAMAILDQGMDAPRGGAVSDDTIYKFLTDWRLCGSPNTWG